MDREEGDDRFKFEIKRASRFLSMAKDEQTHSNAVWMFPASIAFLGIHRQGGPHELIESCQFRGSRLPGSSSRY